MAQFDYNELNPGLLSSPQIKSLLKQGLLLEGYDKECIAPATYHMRIAGRFITCINGQTQEYTLGERDDPSQGLKSKVTLNPNSLTFITTFEKFNLPKSIIARFNLKSKWVHRGLLLGTGPIVDPELNAYLLIPLHNFSNSPIEIPYLSEIISVEFTKTHDPDKIYEINGAKCEYVTNKSKYFEIDKYIERVGTGLPESSIASQIVRVEKSNNETIKELKKFKRTVRNISIIGILAIILASLTLISTVTGLISDANNYVSDAKHQYRSTLQGLSSRVEELSEQINKEDKKNIDASETIQKINKNEEFKNIKREAQ